MTELIVSYTDAVLLGPTIVGGKGWNLGRLHRYGFFVPQGSILTANTYTQFINAPELRAIYSSLSGIQAKDIADPQVSETLHSLQVAIEATAFPPEVESAVQAFLIDSGLANVPVAVRSSATSEDSATSSFAGIHKSFLNVRGIQEVLQAIKGCYASLWTPHALAYRRHRLLADDAIACAVVICAMVTGPEQAPPAAGVAFSCDPRTGQRDRITINAAPGWGEAVVSGSISPEEITIVQGFDGEPVRVERAGEHGQTLTDEQAVVLASLVHRVLWALGDGQEPQDVEWTFDGERFWLVQARPVTHVPHVILPAVAALPTIWSNANTKDVLPGVLTPLSWSILQPIISSILYAPCQAVGYTLPQGLEVMRRFSGHAYFDLTTMLWSYCDAFGLLPHEVNQGMGGHQPEIPVPSQHPLRGRAGPRRILARVRLLQAISRTIRLLSHDMEHIRAHASIQARQPLTDLSSTELLAQLQQLNKQAGAFGYHFQLANLGGVWGEYLIQVLERERPGQGRALASALMAGSRAVTSAEHGYRLHETATIAARDPDARTYLATRPFDPQAWRSLSAHSPFRQAFAAFLDEFGHRAIYEFEIANSRWHEDPSYLLDCVQTLLAQEALSVPYALARTKRQAAEAEVARLPLRARPFVHWFAKQARRSASYREAGKSTLVAFLEPMRALILETGRRMSETHILTDRLDVFFLTWSDLVAFLQGAWDGQGASTLVKDRKEQRNGWLTETPADVFICDAEGRPAALPETFSNERIATPLSHSSTQPDRNSEELQGIGASSGYATGRARVIRHPSEGHALQSGEVLVAPSTDPAWTPLFLRACAIVMETGGYLSHGAIVAREFGIPAVVNIPGLLETVANDQLLTVDGNRGCIALQKTQALPPCTS